MITDHFIETRYGRIHCRRFGRGKPLFLMHSNGKSAHEFDPLAEALQDRFDTVSWDMPNQGDSDRVNRHLTLADYSQLAFQICAALFRAKPMIGGSSIGAMICANMASTRPEAVAGAIAIELPIGRDAAWWRENWAMVEDMFSYPRETFETVAPRYRNPSPELIRRLDIDRLKAGSHAMMDAIWTCRETADDLVAGLSRISCPALFINGDKGVAHAAPTVLAREIPAGRLVIVEDSGHFPHTDDPGAVAAAISASFGTPD